MPSEFTFIFPKASQEEDLKKENADLNFELLHNSSLPKEQEEFEKQIIQLKAEIKTLTQENKALELQFTQAETLKESQLTKNMQQVGSLTKAIAIKRLKTTHTTLTQNLECAKARQIAQQYLEKERHAKIEVLSKQKTVSLTTQQEYENKLREIQVALKEIRLKEAELIQTLAHLTLKEKTEIIQPLKKQVHELRVENIRLHTQTQSLKYTLKHLTKDNEKFDLKKGLEYADLRRDATGFDKISKLLTQSKAPTLNPSNAPQASQSYALGAPLSGAPHPILHRHIPAPVPLSEPDPLKNHRRQQRLAPFVQVKS